MSDKEFNLKLSELTLKHDEYVQREEHWKYIRLLGTVAVTATVTGLLIKVFSGV